jgi:hypothetical protein
VEDPRSDELLRECGLIGHRLGLAYAWTDGLNGRAAKECSRSGSAGWKHAQPLPQQREAAIAFFVTRARKRNPVVAASANGLVLVEIDLNVADDAYPPLHEVKPRIAGLLRRLELRFPSTVVVRSRRGLHFYLRPAPGSPPTKIQISEEDDTVTASTDGYTVGAPGLHELPAVVYEYVSNGAIAELPAATYRRLEELGGDAHAEVRRRFADGEPIRKGDRDTAVFWLAVDLLRDGLSPEETFERALEAGRTRCAPPLDQKLVRKQFKGARKWALEHPTATERLRANARRVLDEQHASPQKQPRRALVWEPPVPFANRPRIPSFPLEALPDWLNAWAFATAREKGASIDLAGTLGLGVVSGSLGRHVQVSPRPGWYEPTNLYVAAALDPGQRKTAVFKAALRPVRTLERKRIREWDEQNALGLAAGEIYEKRRKDLIREAADDEELDAEQLRDRLDDLLGGLSSIEPAPRPRLLTEDVTREGLAQLLAEQGRIIAASDEGAAIIENFAGRYTHDSTSWDLFNKAHSAADLVVDRKSSGPVIVWDPALTLVIATQPKMLTNLWGKPGVEGRGVLARPLYALPEPAYTTGRTTEVPTDVLNEFESRVRALFEDVPLLALDEEGRPQPLTLKLDAAAEAAFERFELELGHKRRDLGNSDRAQDEAAYLGWISKLAGQTARLAACLHAATYWTTGSTINTTINRQTVDAAIDLARYFHAHALVVFGLMGELPEQQRAHTILGWLRTRRETERELLTIRDIHRSRGNGTTAAQVQAALKLLEQHGYVQLERHHPGKAGGRPSERVHINPLLEPRSNTPDKTDRTTRPKGSVGFVGPIEEVSAAETAAEHSDAGCRATRRWLARDQIWRCLTCNPPAFAREALDEREQQPPTGPPRRPNDTGTHERSAP